MNRERLQQMVTMLRDLSPVHHKGFDISDWHCGTSACAVGHACLTPSFQVQGLELQYDGSGWMPAFDGETSWYAVEKFFDLSEKDAEHLFYRTSYDTSYDTTANEVADRIEEFLAGEV